MHSRYRYILLILLIIIVIWALFQYYGISTKETVSKLDAEGISNNIQSNISENLKVTIYYEALCSDSRNFIIKQLLPTYMLLSKYLTLDFVPYGKAKTIESNGKLDFQCQHGAKECLGNKIHACAIDLIEDELLELKMVACLINDGLISFEAAGRCAQENNVNYDALVKCTNDIRSSELLKHYGERTNNVQPPITFIPTIELDGSQKVPLPKILKDLKREICNILQSQPSEC